MIRADPDFRCNVTADCLANVKSGGKFVYFLVNLQYYKLLQSIFNLIDYKSIIVFKDSYGLNVDY